MASEAEFERLYQEFVRRGGGKLTLDSSGLTPNEQYTLFSNIDLTPEQEAQLEAAQDEYNRQQAYNTVLNEIGNFTNPYSTLADQNIILYEDFNQSPEKLAVADLVGTVEQLSPGDQALMYSALASTMGLYKPNSPDIFTSNVGYSSNSWDMDDFLKLAGIVTIGGLAIDMFQNLKSHTNSQVSNLPQKLADVSALADMNKQFGVNGFGSFGQGSSSNCDLFNELMGILSGAFDGALDFIKNVADSVKNFIAPVLNVINQVKDVVKNAIATVLGGIDNIISDVVSKVSAFIEPFKNALNTALNFTKDIIAKGKELIDNVAGQIAKEIAGVINLANDLASKAAALALAAASFDICQLAVLLKTGSSPLVDAIKTLTTPISYNDDTVPMETDSRANGDEVDRRVAAANSEAVTAPGVPQSPLTAAVEKYIPFSSYFNSNVKEIFAKVSDFAENVKSVATSSGSSVVARTESTLTDSESKRRISSDKIVTVNSNYFKPWQDNYVSQLLPLRNDAKKTRMVLEDKLSTFPTDSVTSINQKILELKDIETRITEMLSYMKNKLQYTSKGVEREDAQKEEIAKSAYDTYSLKATALISNSEKQISDVRVYANSLIR